MISTKINLSPPKLGIISKGISFNMQEVDIVHRNKNSKKQDNENIMDHYVKNTSGLERSIKNNYKENSYNASKLGSNEKLIDPFLEKLNKICFDLNKISKRNLDAIPYDKKEDPTNFIESSFQSKAKSKIVQMTNKISTPLHKLDRISQDRSKTPIIQNSQQPIEFAKLTENNLNKKQNPNIYDQDVPLLVRSTCEQAYSLMNQNDYEEALCLLKKAEKTIEKYNDFGGKLDYEFFHLVFHNLALCYYK